MQEQDDNKNMAERDLEKKIIARVKSSIEHPENEFGLVDLLLKYKKAVAESIRIKIEGAYLQCPYVMGTVDHKAGFDKGILHSSQVAKEVEKYPSNNPISYIEP